MRKTNSTKSRVLLVIVIALIAFFGYIGAYGAKNIFSSGYNVKSFGQTIKKGLDLQGGVSLVEEIQSDKVDNATIERTIELLSMRVNKMGVSETVVSREGSKKIRIEIPGIYDAKGVIDSVGKTGELKFKGPDNKVILTGKDVKDAVAQINQETTQPIISFELNEEGTKKFAEATKKFMGQPITIYMDDQVLTSPTVNSIIPNGKGMIEGSKTLEEAKRQANIIKSGALPVTVKPVEVKTVGATLGSDALPLSMKAGAIGIGLILLFMIFYYRVPGLIADLALIFYIILVLSTFVSIKAILTLSGIAGFLLTIGMAVDANVLIFERIKEELKTGKSIKSSVDAGFHRALSSILDSNITTIIASIVLYNLGSGAVKGFALTLMIGIVLSMFTAIVGTRFLLKISVKAGILKNLKTFGVKRNPEGSKPRIFKIINKTKIWFTISFIIIALGAAFMFKSGLNFGIDFKGGTLVQINMKKDFKKQDVSKIIEKYTKEYTTNTATNTKNEVQLEIRSNSLTDEQIPKMYKEIKGKYKLEDKDLVSQQRIGPSVGKELTRKAIIALIVANLAMLVYVGIRFEFRFALAAILSLLHDVLITLSIYAIFQIPVNSSFIAAILTIVGYSINDTIVVFDRIRENSKKHRKVEPEELADMSITQTMTRSINTVITTLFTIVSVCIIVHSIRDFAIPLTIGIVSGAYSSIFIASPLWVVFKSHKKKNRNNK